MSAERKVKQVGAISGNRQPSKFTEKELREFTSVCCGILLKSSKRRISLDIQNCASERDRIESWDWIFDGTMSTTPFTFDFCVDYLDSSGDTSPDKIRSILIKENIASLASVMHVNGDTNRYKLSPKAYQKAVALMEKIL